jgi:hypothetical protein
MFSEDLLSGVRFFGHLADKCDGQQKRMHFNTSCVFFAGSYLESSINELIASVASIESEGTKPSMQFWKTLDLAQKDMPFKKKWDLIASIYNQCWDSSKEPYSYYDDIITIRNELVHFKGNFLENDEVPVRRLKSLTQRFKGESNWKLDALEASFWVHNLLTSKDMGPWIVRTLLEFDLRRDELLTGVPLTEEQIAMHKMKRMFN